MFFPGGNSGEATPVPIPNTEVKLARADGTAGASLWESRTLPGYLLIRAASSAVVRRASHRVGRLALRFFGASLGGELVDHHLTGVEQREQDALARRIEAEIGG